MKQNKFVHGEEALTNFFIFIDNIKVQQWVYRLLTRPTRTRSTEGLPANTSATQLGSTSEAIAILLRIGRMKSNSVTKIKSEARVAKDMLTSAKRLLTKSIKKTKPKAI